MQKPPFEYKTKPYDHQDRIFKEARDREFYALFAEQGTGKSKVALDTAAWLFAKDEITTLMIVAPSAVAPNWKTDEVPRHCSAEHEVFLWKTSSAKTKWHAKAAKAFLDLDDPRKLKIFVISYDAMMTVGCQNFIRSFLPNEQTMLVLDESARIKNPESKRTQKAVALGHLCKVRWAMTGTPISNGPFDVFAQLKFLDFDVWDEYGARSYSAFKSMFGVFTRVQLGAGGRVFDKLVDYRNLPILSAAVDRMGARVLKEDVLDLPPKVYSTRYFDMAPQQAKLYEKLRTEFLIELATDEQISAPLMITRMLRLQQITSGYVPIDLESPEQEQRMVIMDPNPRMAVIREILEDLPHQAIIWGKFKYDIELIMNCAASLKMTAVRYDGSVSADDREIARAKFRSGEAQLFVANPQCAGEGLTLTEAKTVVYYNNSFKLADRLQSEDRAHRIGQDVSVQYIDIVAMGTIDEKIVEALLRKKMLSDLITGDRVKEWIQ